MSSRSTPAAAINGRLLVICEGKEEHALLSAMRQKQLIADIDALVIGGVVGRGNGIDGLRAFLEAVIGVTGFAAVDSTAIIFDNDQSPGDSLQKVQAAITAANLNTDVAGRFSFPTEPWKTASDSRISVTAVALPSANVVGCLDTLASDALQRIYPEQHKCAEAALECAGAAQWAKQKYDKAIVRATMACVNQKNPAASLSILWDQQPEIIPPSDPAFAPLVAILNQL